MQVIITRHGETIENKEGILQGQLPGKLSPEGIRQAEKLAETLKKEKLDYIFSSDLSRAADTTKIIQKYHKKVPAEFTKELRERNLGELQGKRKEDLGINKNKFVADYLENKEGETTQQMLDRGKKFIEQISKRFENKTVLLVGHNGINKAIILAMLGKSINEIGEIPSMKNATITRVNITKNGAIIGLHNCAKHLE
jgi:broad specificity phosphatase PhoE